MRFKTRGVLPGFGLSLGYTVFYVGLLVLLPLSAMVLKATSLGPSELWAKVTDDRALAAYRLSFGAAFAGSLLNAHIIPQRGGDTSPVQFQNSRCHPPCRGAYLAGIA